MREKRRAHSRCDIGTPLRRCEHGCAPWRSAPRALVGVYPPARLDAVHVVARQQQRRPPPAPGSAMIGAASVVTTNHQYHDLPASLNPPAGAGECAAAPALLACSARILHSRRESHERDQTHTAGTPPPVTGLLKQSRAWCGRATPTSCGRRGTESTPRRIASGRPGG